MRRIECVCDYCGKPIKEKAYRLMYVPVDVETDDYLEECEPLVESGGAKDFHRDCVDLVYNHILGVINANITKQEESKTEETMKDGKTNKNSILGMHKAGISAVDIARQTGCCLATVYNTINKAKKKEEGNNEKS